MNSHSYGAHADMLGARFGVRAAEDGHLPHLSAHAAECACWLLLLPPTQCVQMPQVTAGTVH